MFDLIFKNKKVLVTGHTGFKGSWLCCWLNFLGAKVVGLSIDEVSNPSNYSASKISSFIEDFRVDIRDTDIISDLISEIKPDFVFHLAAQALVRPSYENPIKTITTNAIGTANVLEALRQIDQDVVAILITSDKAYENVEWLWGYRENDRIGGKDPYSASKGMAELVIRSYYESFFNNIDSNVRLGVTRAGNVIGGGDWAIDRLVPDSIRAAVSRNVVDIRSPQSTRPWQHVLEPLSGYLRLAQKLYLNGENHGEAYNFGPSADQNYSVGDLIDEMSNHWDQISWRDVSKIDESVHEAALLKLNCDKALFDLNWKPTLGFEETVRMTVQWYRKFYESQSISMQDFTISQINEYTKIAKLNKLSWSQND